MEGSLPSPNFTASNDGPSQDFLGFSSTPIPGNNFKPKWGKKNRQQNWNRFGEFGSSNEGENPHQGNQNNFRGNQNHQGQFQNSPSQRGQFQNSPQMRGSPMQFSPRGRGNFHNGGRGSYQNSPNGGRGGYQSGPYGGRGGYQNSPNGGRGGYQNSPNGGRGGYQNSPNGNQGGYFNPSMLRNPWADLEWAREHKNQGNNGAGGEGGNVEESEGNGDEENHPNDVMSDSMIPQVGESLLERNNDITNVEDDVEEINDSALNDKNETEGDCVENI